MAPQSFILSIVDIDPPMAWPDPGVNPTMQHSVVKVKFSLENRSDKQTFGFVNGKVTRGESLLELVLVGDGYMQNSAVVNVGPGHTAQGFLIMGSWWTTLLHDPKTLPPGQFSLILEYLVEDPHGTFVITSLATKELLKHLTIEEVLKFADRKEDDPKYKKWASQNPDAGLQPGIHANISYGVWARAEGSIDIYPSCQPNGPDYLSIKSLTVNPVQVNADPSGTVVGYDQSVTLSWSVEGGGFPPANKHPGSISSVTLAGPGIAAGGIPVEVIGQRTILGGTPLGPHGLDPFTLTAEGNCGTVQKSLIVGTLIDQDRDGIGDDVEHRLLEKFRPYYKFSKNSVPGGHLVDEKYRPTDVMWYIRHCQLLGGTSAGQPGSPIAGQPGSPIAGQRDISVVLDTAALSADPNLVLSATRLDPSLCSQDPQKKIWFCSSDITRNAMKTQYRLNLVSERVRHGYDWDQVVGGNVGLYGHVVPVPDPKRYNLADNRKFYKIEYWQFFAYNNAAQYWNEGDHDGDWCTVQLIIDAVKEEIISVFHYAHGDEMRFDMGPDNLSSNVEGNKDFLECRGPNFGKEVDIGYGAKVGFLADRNREGHINAQNNLVRFYRDPTSGEHTHPVVYIEYGSHEFWPSQHWSYWAAPAHGGDSYSYLTSTPLNLGEVEHPLSETEAASIILKYNGYWGYYNQYNDNPPGPPLHKEWQWPEPSSIRWQLPDKVLEA